MGHCAADIPLHWIVLVFSNLFIFGLVCGWLVAKLSGSMVARRGARRVPRQDQEVELMEVVLYVSKHGERYHRQGCDTIASRDGVRRLKECQVCLPGGRPPQRVP